MEIPKMLIINNSLAALKFIYSLKKTSFEVKFYGLATRDDLKSLYVKHLENVFILPCGDAKLNYCNIELILEAAKKFKVDYVWPGWGYLSEDSALPRVLSENGFKFLGPGEESMKMLGDKHAANVLCRKLEIRYIPFINVKIKHEEQIKRNEISDEKNCQVANLKKFSMKNLQKFSIMNKNAQDEIIKQLGVEEIVNRGDIEFTDLNDKLRLINHFISDSTTHDKKISEKDDGIGDFIMSKEYLDFIANNNFPLLLKLSMSGGGKGIRIVNNQDELLSVYETVKGEGLGDIILCKIVDNARHIELQMARDKHGNTICLGGRDCTFQRRHQKLLEESLIIDKKIFRELKKCGKKLMNEVKYEGIATVEFLLKDDQYYFLEVNTRIQVEHPVTELESGINIPQIQMIIATGGKICKTKPKKRKKHVIGIRIVAEDPWNGFLPVSGDYNISYINHPNIFAYFVTNNGTIGKYSDSQFGHIFAVSRKREKCIKILIDYLSNISIEGINTNISFMLELIKTKFFYVRNYDIKTIETIMKEYEKTKIKDLELLNKTGAIYEKYKESISLNISEKVYSTKVRIKPFILFGLIYTRISNKKYQELEFTHEGLNYKITAYVCSPDSIILEINNSYAKFGIIQHDTKYLINSYDATEIVSIRIDGAIYSIEHKTGFYKFTFLTNKQVIFSPTDGKVIKFYKNNNEHIEKNENLFEIEIMKMRHCVISPFSGILNINISVDTYIKANDIIGHIKNDTKNDTIFSDFMFKNTIRNEEHIKKDFLIFNEIEFNIFILANVFKGYIFPSLIWEIELNIENIDINRFIGFLYDFQHHVADLNTVEKALNLVLLTLKRYFKTGGCELKFEKPLVEVLELIDTIIIEKKLTDNLYDNLIDIKSYLSQYKFKKRNFYYNSQISEKNFKDYIRKNCCYKEGILFSICNIHEYFQELVEKYLKNALGNVYSDFIIDITDFTNFSFKFMDRMFRGIFFKCEDLSCKTFVFNQDLILHYNCMDSSLKDHLYINLNSSSPFIKYRFNNVSYQSDEVIHSIIRETFYDESDLIYKDIFRNLSIFQKDNRLLIVYRIDTHSQSSLMNIKDLSHAIKEILCAIILTKKKTGCTKGKFTIILAGKILIDPEYIQRIADDCMFYYSNNFIKNGVNECEILYTNQNENKICFRIIRGFLEKFVYENDILMEYSIENEIIHTKSISNKNIASFLNSQIAQDSKEREIVRRSNTIHIDDFLFLFSLVFHERNLTYKLTEFHLKECGENSALSDEMFKYHNETYVLSDKINSLIIGIQGYLFNYNSNQFILLINNLAFKNGSFSKLEYIFYTLAIRKAKTMKIPFVFISSNSGARIGLYDKLKKEFNHENNKFYVKNGGGVIKADDEIISIYGNTDSGPENLSFSGLLASETVEAYENIFTLSYVTGRSVGIGAYINKLSERIIQRKDSSILLTGYQALNKLLQSNVYKSNTEIGGVSVMDKNGNNHLTVDNDLMGVREILTWLDYYFKAPKSNLQNINIFPFESKEERRERFIRKYSQNKTYRFLNEREIIETIIDSNTMKEYKVNYAPNIILARAKIGGKSLGIISTESDSTRNGVNITNNVLFPDSSDKIAQSINDFSNESLNILIIANFKGFSGGKKQMEENILKYGSEIVRSLKHCKTKVLIYIPPNGQVRGGSWVVFDKNINKLINICAHPTSEVGIMEPDGICELKFKEPERMEVFKRFNDDYTYENGFRMGVEFCKLHDKVSRMYINGMIDEIMTVEELKQNIERIIF